MADFSRFVANKLNGEWSASNVSSMLTDTILEYLVTGDKWESLDPLVRSRLLLAPLFMRKRELAELQPALEKLAAAGAADKDEWVRAMAQSVDGYDGRLHTDRLLAGSKLVAKTVSGMQPLLDKADPRLFRPLEEVYMNKDLLQKLRGGANGAGIQQAQQAVGAAGAGAPKPHHHFRLRPATEAPSQRQAGSAATPAGRQQQSLSGATGAGASPVAMRTVAGSQRPRGGGGDREGGSSAAAAPAAGLGIRPGRPAPSSIDSMFLPRKPGLGRPSGSSLGGRGRGAAAQPRRAATLDIESVKNLHQQRQAERERQLKAEREAAEAAAREKAEAKERERAVKEAEKELEAKRVAAARAAEKAAKKEAQEAAKVESSDAKEKAKAAKAAAKSAKEDAAAAKAAKAAAKAAKEDAAAAKAAEKAAKDGQRGAKGSQRKRAAPGGSDGEEPPTKRHSASDEAAAGQREAAAVVAAAVQRPAAALAPAPVLMSPEATAAALGDAALAAAADAARVPGLEGAGGVPNLEIMHSFLTAAYGGVQQESSDESEPDI
ncbi:hypothetical protein ABPG77_005613 [Micractinium sp. CCAP 211/92]